MHFIFIPKGVCSTKIEFDLDEEKKLSNVRFSDGCSGNLQALARLTEGMDAAQVIDQLQGIDCDRRLTSCADQLAKAVAEAAARVK